MTNRALLPLRLLPALGLLFVLATPAAAKKTDILVLGNGDRITGEIDRLERGRLYYKTDDMGTLAIEWDKVSAVTAAAPFEIESLGGRMYYGALIPAPRRGTLRVAGSDTTSAAVLELLDVGRISRLGATFWKRLDGSIDLGTSYTSSSDLFKFDFDSKTVYERPGYKVQFGFTAAFTRQTDVKDTRRLNTGIEFLSRRQNRWIYFGGGQVEKNPELGYNLRGSLAGGWGRYLAQSTHDDLLTAWGLSVNREEPLEGETTTNPEVLLTLQYGKFSYDFPKVDIQVSATLFEGIKDWGRTRGEFTASIKREMLKDFNVTLKGYESYDSKPPTEGSSKNDYGTSFALGWTY